MDPDPFVRGMDPRIRIHTKMSWIDNTDFKSLQYLKRLSPAKRRPMYRETVPDAAYQSFLGKYVGLRASLPHTASHLLVIGRLADPDSIGFSGSGSRRAKMTHKSRKFF